jgi:hypothetical protein
MLRLVGLGFLSLGFVVLLSDILRSGDGPLRLTALGEWWFWLHRDSLQLLQPAIERHLSPRLWDPGVQTLLEWPLAVEMFALSGLCFVAVAIHRR